MSVDVDDAVTLWRGRRWAHLMADTLAELHHMAARLGIPRGAFHDRPRGAHHDLAAPRREQAIAPGAVAISSHDDRERMRAVIRTAKWQATTPDRTDLRRLR